MNPIQVLKSINEAKKVDVFDWSRYQLKASEVAEIVEYYEEKFPSIAELDPRLEALKVNIEEKIELMKSRIR